jgi:hypothetical protein
MINSCAGSATKLPIKKINFAKQIKIRSELTTTIPYT